MLHETSSRLFPSLTERLNAFGIVGIAALFSTAFLFTGCADESLLSEPQTTPRAAVTEATDYAPAILRGGYASDDRAIDAALSPDQLTTLSKGGGSSIQSTGSFASPLFGLTTAPDGDILVADVPVGVVSQSGGTEYSLFGVSDMATVGRNLVWASVGLTGDPGDDTGQGVYQMSRGRMSAVADLYEFEAENNPDGGAIDSNPFDIAAQNAHSAFVADAAANALLRVTNRGEVEVVAVFPDELVSTANFQGLVGCPTPFISDFAFICDVPAMPAQAVPTSVAIGPDGAVYVGELKGFPAPAGASNIWRIEPDASGAMCGEPDSGCQKVFDGGFTSIIDMAFGPDGNLYVAELDEGSWAAVEIFGAPQGGAINSCDLTTLSCTDLGVSIPILTAITFGKDGTLRATENALIPGAADVITVP
jgi:hypothetical protein